MPCAQKYNEFLDLIDNHFDVYLIFASRINGNIKFARVNITTNVQSDFSDLIRRALGNPDNRWNYEDRRLLAYHAGHKSDSKEISYITIPDHGPLADYQGLMPDLANMPVFDQDSLFIKGLIYYIYLLRLSNGKYALLFRRHTMTKELMQSSRFGIRYIDGAFDKLQDRLFIFDDRVDCILYGRCIYFKKEFSFRKIFRYDVPVVRSARRAAGDLNKNVKIVNFEKFKRDIESSESLASKMTEISNRPYFRKLTTQKIIEAIRFSGKEEMISVVDGRDAIVYDSKMKTDLLRVLNDDYLSSPMTDLSYEASYKREFIPGN